MTPRIYKPGEVDEDAYGPSAEEPPPLPDWNTKPEDQGAFVQWSLAMLDREAEELNFESAARDASANDDAVMMLREMMDMRPSGAFDQARKLMPHLTWEAFRLYRYGAPKEKMRKLSKRGRKPNPNVAAAVIDNARLTAIFRRHFNGAYRRPGPPSRMDILRMRHKLSDEDCITVEGYITKFK